MLSVLRSWEIILVSFSGGSNPLTAGRGVQAHAPLQQPPPSPRWIPVRIPSSQTDGEPLARPRSLIFPPSAQLC